MKTFKLRWFRSEVGFTLIEVLIATILFALIAVAFAASFMNGSVLMTNTGDRQEALNWAQAGADETKSKTYAQAKQDVDSSPSSTYITTKSMFFGPVRYFRQIKMIYVSNSDFTVPGPTNGICVASGCGGGGTDPCPCCIGIDVTVSNPVYSNMKSKFEPVELRTAICSMSNSNIHTNIPS